MAEREAHTLSTQILAWLGSVYRLSLLHIYQDVVRLDVSVDDPRPLQQFQRHEKLLAV